MFIAVFLLSFSYSATAQAETLLEIFNLAEQHEPQYAAVKAKYDAAIEVQRQAFGHAWLPTLSFDARSASTKATVTALFGGGNYQFQAYRYGLNLTQPLWNAELRSQLKQAKGNQRKALLNINDAHQTLMMRVATAYFDFVLARSKLDFAEAEKAALSQRVKQAKVLIESGLATLTDREEAQAGYDLAVAKEVQAEQALYRTEHALQELTGEQQHKPSGRLDEAMPLKHPQPKQVEAWVAHAQQQNPSLLALMAAKDVATEAIAQAWAGHLPTLGIEGSYETSSSGGQFGNTVVDQWSVGIVLNMPLYEGGTVQSKVRENDAHLEEVKARVEAKRRELERLTRDAYIAVNADLSQIKAMMQAVRSSKALVNASRMGVEVGSRTTLDVVMAEQKLYAAKLGHIRALHDYILDSLRLKHASGILAEEDLVYFSRWLVEPYD